MPISLQARIPCRTRRWGYLGNTSARGYLEGVPSRPLGDPVRETCDCHYSAYQAQGGRGGPAQDRGYPADGLRRPGRPASTGGPSFTGAASIERRYCEKWPWRSWSTTTSWSGRWKRYPTWPAPAPRGTPKTEYFCAASFGGDPGRLWFPGPAGLCEGRREFSLSSPSPLFLVLSFSDFSKTTS